MKLIPGSILAAAALLGFTARADDKPGDTQTKQSDESTSSSTKITKSFQHGKKKASKRQQLNRGAGPVGDEGASKSVRSSESATSSDTGPGATTTSRKATKETQIERGAGPEGTEGTSSTERSTESKSSTTPGNADQPKQ